MSRHPDQNKRVPSDEQSPRSTSAALPRSEEAREDLIVAQAVEALNRANDQARQRGPVVGTIGTELVRIHVDGRREVIGTVRPPVPVKELRRSVPLSNLASRD